MGILTTSVIERWKEIAKTGYSKKRCAYCKVYSRITMPCSEACLSCPIKNMTGMRSCIGTPYYNTFRYPDHPDLCVDRYTSDAMRRNQAMLDWLLAREEDLHLLEDEMSDPQKGGYL